MQWVRSPAAPFSQDVCHSPSFLWQAPRAKAVLTAVVAEKPSVARDIAAVLGAGRRGEGYLEGAGHIITWAVGHLVALAEPQEINPAWRRWSLGTLPMLPAHFPLSVLPGTRGQFEIVRKILLDRAVDQVVCATDAGREGELIFRYIYEASGCKKPVRRLWISSLTEDAIKEGLRRMKSGAEYDSLADAAKGRSRADWLVGLNLSRAYSLTLDQEISVGRVQTPTLGMLVERELAIRSFVPEDYLEVVATFEPFAASAPGSAQPVTYEGTWSRPKAGGEAPDRAQNLETKAEAQGREPSEDLDRALRRLPPDGALAAEIVRRALAGKATIDRIEAKTKRLPPPLLYDLTELQRHANRLYGMSAHRTLEVAQALYERHKLLSYPRTDSRHLSSDVAETLGNVVRAVADRYPGLVAPGSGSRPLGRRFVDDSKVTDHHAILPTPKDARGAALSAEEHKIYDLVCRRLLMAWHEDHVLSITRVWTRIVTGGSPPIVDMYESRGTTIETIGWKALDVGGGSKAPGALKRRGAGPSDGEAAEPHDRGDPALPPGLVRGMCPAVRDAHPVTKQTRPPPRYTEATLLTAMETAGRHLEEKELSDAMKDLGLGTPATRAQIIETLLLRQYVVREGKALSATEKGIHLIEVVHPEVKSPALTGEWEAKLRRLSRGQGDLRTFLGGIERFVEGVVEQVKAKGEGLRAVPTHHAEPAAATHHAEPAAAPTPRTTAPRKAAPRMSPASHADPAPQAAPQMAPRTTAQRTAAPHASPAPQAAPQTAPRTTVVSRSTDRIPAPTASVITDRILTPAAPGELLGLLRSRFGFSGFRPHQEAVCRTATLGRDLLLVMPTGAGKSLCYQLPGIARGGTTLVVSPLIALMEDQCAALCAKGFRAERIHSGRERQDLRRACADYLAGRLDFLFIAPERLKVPGFPEMLAKRKVALIAVDEAHCISQWGHDFRPDYRLLGQRLPALRPAPIVALTATAAPDVQDDIVAQLGLANEERFIHGFRRTNIAVEVLDMSPGQRADAIFSILADKARRPAIVYAATRKSAEALAKTLGKKVAAAYHAGMEAQERDEIQSAFLSGTLDVVVATIAFGMGIDKPNVRTVIHAALPGSLSGYYQEIGRAGRDGLPSSAVLFHSFVDRKIHESFLERDYPDPDELRALFDALRKAPLARDKLRRKVKLDRETFDKALEKLVLHGGAREVEDGVFARAEGAWEGPYQAQRAHRQGQIEAMARFAGAHGCRMVHMVRHFGDREDSGAPCGLCDACAPKASVARSSRQPTPEEKISLIRILSVLDRADELPTGRLYREAFPNESPDRRAFDGLLGDLARAGLVTVQQASFQKDGQTITYQRAGLTDAGRQWDGVSAVQVLETPQPKRPSRAGERRPRKNTKSKRTAAKAPKTTGQAAASARKRWFARRGRPKGA